MNRRPLVRTLLASAAIAAAIALAGCDTDGSMMPGRALAPLSEKMIAEIEQKNMDKDSPILVRVFKTEAELEVWKKDRSGQYALLKTYPVCRWSGDLGPKIKEGDRQAPEGFYTITPGQMNPNSQFYLAFNLGFPNAYDQANGRTGQFLMVHGDCSSRGCYAMTDEQMSEIYALGRESFFGGQKAFQVQAYPFRMTPANMAKHRNSPHMAYWKMIKQGYDHFEVTHQEPKVDVCEKRYVFDAAAPANSSRPVSFNPRGKCPVFEVPQEIRDAVNEKKRQDEYWTAQLIARGTPVAPNRNGVDGGMNQVFLAKLEQSAGAADADARMAMVANAAPGSIPLHTVAPARPTTAAEATPAPVVVASNVPVPRPAPLAKEGVAPEPPPTTIASLFDSVFRTASVESKPVQIPEPAENVRLRGSETAKAAAPPAPVAAATSAPPVASPVASPVAPPVTPPVTRATPAPPARVAPPVRIAAPAPAKPEPKPEVLPPAPRAVASATVASRWPEPVAVPPEPKTIASAPVVAPKPEPVAKPPTPKTIASAPVVAPKPEPVEKLATPKAVARSPAVQPKPRAVEEAKAAPASQLRTAYAAPLASNAGLLSGAQPVVPIGSFASR